MPDRRLHSQTIMRQQENVARPCRIEDLSSADLQGRGSIFNVLALAQQASAFPMLTNVPIQRRLRVIDEVARARL